MKITCFDIGGTKISMALVEADWVQKKYDFLDYQQVENLHQAREIENLIFDYAKKNQSQTNKISISSARLVQPKTLTVSDTLYLYGVDEFNFRFFEPEGFEVRLENDGHCFALGEHLVAPWKAKGLLTLTLGTGIGGGYIFNNSLFSGVHYSALEVSHMIIEKNGRECGCGQKGCWGEYAAGKAIEVQYKNLSGQEKKAEDIFSLYQQDEAAKKVIDEATDYLALGLVNLMNVLDPEEIVFGGSLSNQQGYVESVMEKAKSQCFNKKADYRFRISELKDKSNLLGAAALWK